VKGWTPTPADSLTLLRLLATPVLWVLAYLQLTVHLGIGLALAGLTDVVDGPVARWTGRASPYGSQLDSLADILLMGSIIAWIAWLHPAFFRDNLAPLLVWVVIGVAAVVATWVRLRRIGNLHLYSAKVAGVVGYVFAVWLFVLGDYSPLFFAVAVGLAIVASTETLLVALIRDRADERVRSILSRPR
jgi:phosphatidylglycerophosphate synthase